MSEHHCAIYFNDPAYTLDDARNALDELGLEIVREGECLNLSGEDLPSFAVRLLDDAATVPAQAQRIAARFGPDTREGRVLAGCDRCLWVGIGDFDQALDEINTMMEVQAALQDATGGVLFLSWNGHLSLPYGH